MSSIGSNVPNTNLQSVTQDSGFSRQGAVNAQISSQMSTLQGLSADLQGLIASLQAEMANEPQVPSKPSRPSDPDDKGAMAKYNSDLSAYNSAVSAHSAWQGRINGLKSQIRAKEGQIDKAESKLNQLQNSDLPNAKRLDQADVDRAADNAKKAAENDAKAANAGASKPEDRVDVAKLSVKAQIVKEAQPKTDKLDVVNENATKFKAATKTPAPAGGGLPSIKGA